VVQDHHVVCDLWIINPWLTSHMIGAAHSQRIDAAEQERGRAMFAALSERSAAATMETRQEDLSARGASRPEVMVIIEVVLTSAK
jgi:hypothetical protein